MDPLAAFGAIPVNSHILKSTFKNHRSVGHKISSLENKGKLIRLKRGLYVVSPEISHKELSLMLIANHLYGPSYVSMETALRYYGMIPEAVYSVQSLTVKRSKIFENTLSQFIYYQSREKYYSVGIKQVNIDDEYSFLMASPEKALCDLILFTPKLRPRFVKSMAIFLEEDLRLDMEAFYKMDVSIFEQCYQEGKKKNEILNLIKLLNNESL